MTFKEVLAQVVDWLQQDGRVSYRALKLQFDLDDDYIEGLKDELIYAQQVAKDEDNRVLVWSGGTGKATASTSQPDQITQPDTQTVQSTFHRI